MKTVVIYDTCGENTIQFFVLDGDYSRFDGFRINASGNDPVAEDEICGIIYDADGNILPQMLDAFPVGIFPLAIANGESVKVIVVTWLP